MMGEECPNCRQLTNASFSRLVKDTCGHTKCRMCLVYEEQGCKACQNEHQIKTIGNFDYPPATAQLSGDTTSPDKETTIVNEEVILPLELVINKLPDPFEIESSETIINPLIEESIHIDRLSIHKEMPNICESISNNNGNTHDTTILHIPKMEPLELISSIRTHLEESTDQPKGNDLSDVSKPEARTSESENVKVDSNYPSKEKAPKNKKQRKYPDRSHISVIPGSPEKYKCGVCGKIFRNKKGKCYHDACVTGIKPYQCTICDKSFVKRSHFEYHERVHSGYKPYKCTLCDKAFPQKNKLNRHMYSHNKEKQFICTKCGKGYSKRDDLRNHLNLHAGLAPYSCKVCGKSFRMLTNLKRHMHTHSSERPHVCEQCGKSFKDKSLLVRHKRTHGKDRPFSCAHCVRVFLSKSELRRHLAVHSDDKPFSCEFCNTVFRRKDNLNRHIRHHHSEDSNYDSTAKEQCKLPEKEAKPIKPKQTCVAKQKQKPKSKPRIALVSLPKSPAKISVVYVNSRDQINSRLDSMGNITPIIRTTGEVSNAVPVINGPISIKKLEEKRDTPKKTLTYMEPMPLAEAVVINRRIEEKLYSQNVPNHHYFFRNCSTLVDRQLPIHKLSPVRPNLLVKSPSYNKTSFPEKLSFETSVASRRPNAQNQSNSQKQSQSNSNEIVQQQNTTKDSITSIQEAGSKHTLLKKRVIQELEEGAINIGQGYSAVTDLKKSSSKTIQAERANCVSTITKRMCQAGNHEMGSTKINLADDKVSSITKVSEIHWRRRTSEILKPCTDYSKQTED
ncbi:zinc finger protein 394 [Cephus cinctus]|uniref:Zinc finger protein 394 n=1 Tax=Cephus cinctus TaxID=211228 RepID=A0AAJ7FKF4_CEPCN|nr:zinc finger protein 394 [Cephus cinctus]